MDAISLTFSGLALVISIATTWFTLLRRGVVKATRPTLIFFGPDGSRGPTKIFLRAFIYSTGDRGQIVEQLFVRLVHGVTHRTFGRWIVRDGALSRGTGLTVERRGAATDHHFVLADGDPMVFQPGEYMIELYATVVDERRPRLLTAQRVCLTDEQARSLNEVDAGVFFDWNPELADYGAQLDRNRTAELNAAIREQMKLPPSISGSAVPRNM